VHNAHHQKRIAPIVQLFSFLAYKNSFGANYSKRVVILQSAKSYSFVILQTTKTTIFVILLNKARNSPPGSAHGTIASNFSISFGSRVV
jgi:hypothetical protein